jgi:ribulose-phosphate 3-epimerase
MPALYPSLIAANQLSLQHTLDSLDTYVDGYHLDIMDNRFVPNLTWGHGMINAIAAHTTRQLWVHLMVDNPDSWVSQLGLPQESIVTFHIESSTNPLRIIHAIQRKEWYASVALNPRTPLDPIIPLLPQLDQVLIMSVEPGFSGQRFIENSMARVETIAQHKNAHNLALRIGIDGGVNRKNIARLASAGAQDFAVGAAIFKAHEAAQALEELRKSLSILPQTPSFS